MGYDDVHNDDDANDDCNFNSLYGIPNRDFSFLSFFSSISIPFMGYGYYITSEIEEFTPFQFPLWDTVLTTKLVDTINNNFNSLYGILFFITK